MGAHVLADGPIDRDVGADRRDQLPGDGAEGIIAEDLDGAVVGFEGVVEGDFIIAEPERFAALAKSRAERVRQLLVEKGVVAARVAVGEAEAEAKPGVVIGFQAS